MAVGTSEQSYEEIVRGLSDASVRKHFDAFEDIAWDDPEYAVVPDDPRWILPSYDPLGRTAWYQALPQSEQIRVGRYRYSTMLKVGLQFEQVLVAGIMHHAMTLPNGAPEFRYSTHEATEECHHTQMFQELVNRLGTDTKGAERWFRRVAPLLPLAAGPLPFVFFIGVLAGEEPIDYFQKLMLRNGLAETAHPLMTRVVQIHVAEEARHIGFAHEYLKKRAGNLNRRQRALLSIAFPVAMRVLCDVIMKPSKEMRRACNIPDEVVREAYWESPESQELLRNTFADARALATELGLMNRAARRTWKALRIDGRPSRFRSEPGRVAA